jgi:hypothetical protein
MKPDKSLAVRKSEVVPANGRDCIDMEAAIIVGLFN